MKKEKRAARRHPRGLSNVYVLCMAASLAAISFLLGFLAKATQGTGILRITFENLPVIFSGIAFGPLVGAAVGIGADLLSCLTAGQFPLPLITVGAAAIGAVSGFMGRAVSPKKPRYLQILLCEAAAQIIGSLIIKTAALALAFPTLEGWLFFLRVPTYLLIILVESLLLLGLLRAAPIKRVLLAYAPARGRIKNKKEEEPK